MTNGWIVLGAALLIAAIAAVTDTRTGRIPNWLCLPPLVLAPCLYFLAGGPLALAQSFVGAVAGGLVPYLLFRSEAAGGGDVKLFAALGAITGVHFVVEAQLFSFLIAAAFSVCLVAARGQLGALLSGTLRLALTPFGAKKAQKKQSEVRTPIRLGFSIFLGVLLSTWLTVSSIGWSL